MVFKLFGNKVFGGKTQAAAPVPSVEAIQVPSVEAILAEMEARTGASTRPAELPAWALLFRSPYETPPGATRSDATSWLGGMPTVPPEFVWPSGDDGRPLHFIAQIDLAALQPEPTTGARAPGLPTEGALLVFVGGGYAVRVLSAREMRNAAPATPPKGLVDVGEHGFWGEGPTFTRRAVDPVPYLSRGEERPDFLPDPFAEPRQWITTWGLAALEASLVQHELAQELRLGREFMEFRRSRAELGETLARGQHIDERVEHCDLMEDQAPPLLAALQDWQAMAVARPAEAPVDIAALNELFGQRMRLVRAMKHNFGARSALAGDARVVWERILADAPGPRSCKDLSAIAPAYRPFVATRFTDWRGHRLFGIEPEFPNNDEDLRRQNPLISIAADTLLGNESEHDYGFSIWLLDEDIARGRHAGGQFIRHCAV